jgi:protein-tyrosine phosphatase
VTTSNPLPKPRYPDRPYQVAVVCLGNICRSPMANVVLRDALDRSGFGDRAVVDSAGTGDWHLGHPMDRRAAAVLATAGYDGSAHRAPQFPAEWYDRYDLILAMDENNFRDISAMAPDEETARERVRMFREFDPRSGFGDVEVPDPYYGGDDGFALVLHIVERTSEGLAEALARHLA